MQLLDRGKVLGRDGLQVGRKRRLGRGAADGVVAAPSEGPASL
jgi:hypothetical protein